VYSTWTDIKIRTSRNVEGARSAENISRVLESGLLEK